MSDVLSNDELKITAAACHFQLPHSTCHVSSPYHKQPEKHGLCLGLWLRRGLIKTQSPPVEPLGLVRPGSWDPLARSWSPWISATVLLRAPHKHMISTNSEEPAWGDCEGHVSCSSIYFCLVKNVNVMLMLGRRVRKSGYANFSLVFSTTSFSVLSYPLSFRNFLRAAPSCSNFAPCLTLHVIWVAWWEPNVHPCHQETSVAQGRWSWSFRFTSPITISGKKNGTHT